MADVTALTAKGNFTEPGGTNALGRLFPLPDPPYCCANCATDSGIPEAEIAEADEVALAE
jgi:hypothetical protein